MDNIIHGRRVQASTPWVIRRTAELSQSATDLIDALLHPDPAERLGGPLRGSEVRVHPFFWGFDWSQIEKRQVTPPHAARCRERALATTQHPALQLPPLPSLRHGAEGGGGRTGALDAMPESMRANTEDLDLV